MNVLPTPLPLNERLRFAERLRKPAARVRSGDVGHLENYARTSYDLFKERAKTPLRGACVESNLDRYKKDLNSLLARGHKLFLALQRECLPKDFEREMKKVHGAKAEEIMRALPSFNGEYQAWYSEAHAVIRQLLPDRLADFVRYYEKPKSRREISFENYRIEDALQGLTITRQPFHEKIAGPEAAIPHLRQQLSMLESVTARFQSSLFDIRRLVQADMFDSELDAGAELLKNGFARAAGALAGVVLERHLAQVCDDHAIKIAKKAPGLAELNSALKDAAVIDVPQWRFIQHLADIRNLCDHSKKTDPTKEQVADLLAGVGKVTKTVF